MPKMTMNPLRLDPTRTTTERKILMAEMARRCASLRRAIRELIVTEDAFGITAQAATEAARAGQSAITSVVHTTPLDMVFNTKFMFDTDEKKVAAYQEWFKNEVKAGLLEVDAANADTPWLSKNIKGAYKKGALRAYMDANKGKGDNLDFLTGGKTQFMKNAFDGPVAEGKMRALYTRSFTQLKGVTAQMDSDMSRILAQGLAQGKSAAAVAKDLENNVSGLEKKRCMTIARTEIVHAHNEGQLDAFEEMNMEGVGVMAEWSTAHDGLVCPLCSPMEGVVMTIKEARGILPRHPNCRCAWIPGSIGEHKGGTTKRTWAGPEQGLEAPGTLPTGKTTGQTFSKIHGDIALRDSIKAEFPKLGIKEARKATKWRGAEKSITGKLNPGSKKALAETEAKKAAKKAALAAKKAEAEAAQQAASAAHGDKVKLGIVRKKHGLDVGDLEALDGETMALTDAGLDKYAAKFNIKLSGEEKLLIFDTPAPTDGTLFLAAQMDKANEVIQAAVVKAEEAAKAAKAAARAEAKIAKAAAKAAEEATAKAEAAYAAKLAQEAADKATAEAAAKKAAQEAAEAAKKANIDTKTADVKAAMAKWSKETPPSVDVIDAGDFSGIPGWENAAGAQSKQSYGVVIFDDEGRVLLRRPTDDIHTGKPFGGAAWTFAKGGGYKPALTATTEVGEEVGEIAGIHDIIPGTFKGTTGQTNYFVGRSMGYDASLLDVNPETAAVKWVTFEDAVKLIGESEDLTVRKRDLAVLNAAFDVAKNSDGSVFKGIVDAGNAKLGITQVVDATPAPVKAAVPKAKVKATPTPAPGGTVWEPTDILKNGALKHTSITGKLKTVYGFDPDEAEQMAYAFSKSVGGAIKSQTPEAFDAWVKTPRFLNKLPAPKPPEPVNILWEADDFQPNGLVKMEVLKKKLMSVGYTESQTFDIDNDIMGSVIGLNPEKTKEIALVKLHAAVNEKIGSAAISASSDLDIPKFFEWKKATFIDDIPDTKVALDLHNITLLPKAEQSAALKKLVNKYETEYTFKQGPSFNPNQFFSGQTQVVVPTPPPGAVASFDFIDPKKPKLTEIKKGLGLGTNGAAQNDLYDEFLEWGGWSNFDELPKDNIVETINQFKLYKSQLPPVEAPVPKVISIPDTIPWYKGDTFSNGTLKGVAINKKLDEFGFTPDEISGFYGYVQAKKNNVFIKPGEFKGLLDEYKAGLPGGAPKGGMPPPSFGTAPIQWSDEDFYPEGAIKGALIKPKLAAAGFTPEEAAKLMGEATFGAPTHTEIPATLKKMVADAQMAKAYPEAGIKSILTPTPTPPPAPTPSAYKSVWPPDATLKSGVLKKGAVVKKIASDFGFSTAQAKKQAEAFFSAPVNKAPSGFDEWAASTFPAAGAKKAPTPSYVAPVTPTAAPVATPVLSMDPDNLGAYLYATFEDLEIDDLELMAKNILKKDTFDEQVKALSEAIGADDMGIDINDFIDDIPTIYKTATPAPAPAPKPVAPTYTAPATTPGMDVKAALKAGISIPGPVQTHPDDKYFETVLKAAKTVNHHAGDKAYNTGTLAQYATTMSEIKGKLAAGGLDTKTKEMLEYYVKWSEGIDSAKAAGTVFPEAYTTPKFTYQTIYNKPSTGDIVPVQGAGFNDAATFDDLGALGGSTGARKVKVKEGGNVTQWAMKDYSGRDLQAENEFFTNTVYNSVSPGSAPISRLGYIKNRNGETSAAVFNKFVDGGTELGKTTGAVRTAAEKTARENFVLDAWLANWDTVGLNSDNMMVLPDGRVVRIDNGGALLFRAQGGLKGKDFGPKVGELETFHDAKLNPSASKLYKGITQRQIADQIERLEAAVSGAGGIHSFLEKAGISAISDAARRTEIYETLIARFNHLQEVRDKIEGLSRVPLNQRLERLAEVQMAKANKATTSTKNEANAALNKATSNLKQTELTSIRKYTGNSYGSMNEAQLEAAKKGLRATKDVQAINEGLAKLPGYKGILGRGHKSYKKEEWTNWTRGSWAQVHWTCPASSSANPPTVFRSGPNGICFVIRSKGNRNAYVQDISSHPGEHEALNMGDSTFRVVGWAESPTAVDPDGDHYRFIVMDELDAGEEAPYTQAAPVQLDPTELWKAFSNDAARAEMPGYRQSGWSDAKGQGVNDFLEKHGIPRY